MALAEQSGRSSGRCWVGGGVWSCGAASHHWSSVIRILPLLHPLITFYKLKCLCYCSKKTYKAMQNISKMKIYCAVCSAEVEECSCSAEVVCVYSKLTSHPTMFTWRRVQTRLNKNLTIKTPWKWSKNNHIKYFATPDLVLAVWLWQRGSLWSWRVQL